MSQKRNKVKQRFTDLDRVLEFLLLLDDMLAICYKVKKENTECRDVSVVE